MDPRILAFPLGTLDAHVHTRFSADSRADPQEMAARAQALGLRGLVFTDHMEFDPAVFGYGHFDAGAAGEAIADTRARFPGLAIFRGVEITFFSQHAGEIRDFLRAQAFDYALGSVHVIDGEDLSLDDPEARFFRSRDVQAAYGRYFAEVLALVESGLFNALGHLDICKRYGHRHYGPMDWRSFEIPIRRILDALIASGMVLEVNTSGLRQAPGEPYPALAVAVEYARLGGRRLLLGSDAHRPEDLGHGFTDLAGRLGAGA